MKKLDFEKLAATLLSRSRTLLPEWLPGGRLVGQEYTCGSIRGEQGDSFKVNVNTGKWSDFATGEKGGDLTSLYAAINGVDQGKAAKTLAERVGVNISGAPRVEPPDNFEVPPKGSPVPNMSHHRFGEPTSKWAYKDQAGRTLFFICRYDPDGKKQFVPWTYNSLHKWQCKAWPEPRPLYGLSELAQNPKRNVLIVEGEKAADNARTLVGNAYNVVTWSGGSKAWAKTDWTPIHGKKVLLWPDADQPGREAMAELGQQLFAHVPEMKFLRVEGKPDGWDAADAVADGMVKDTFFEWAKTVIKQTKPSLTPDVLPAQKVERIEKHSVELPTIKVEIQDEIEISTSMAALYEKLGLAKTKQGMPICNGDNCLRVLEGLDQFKDKIWYDEFHFKFYTSWPDGEPREWSEYDDTKLMHFMQRFLGLHRINERMISGAVVSFALTNKKNQPRDWLNSLSWDGVHRIDEFFVSHMGAKDSDYTRAISKNFWVSMAARILKPGCKFDNMVIFEGKQGIYKSTALKVIASPWYVEANESIMSKDFYLQLQGRLIVEIAELDSFSKAEVNTIKKVISTASDRFRPPYGKNVKEFPRQSIFCGTTNDDEYLRDPTGARRFWPVLVSNIDLGRITADREQLFAEAVARFKLGESWWDVPQEMAKEEQEARRQTDAWEDVIGAWLYGRGAFSIQEVWTGALTGDLSRLDRMTQLRIGKILRTLGYVATPHRRMGRVEKLWSPIGEPLKLDEVRTPLGITRPRNFAPGADNSHLDDL